jgi:hypothetical protein
LDLSRGTPYTQERFLDCVSRRFAQKTKARDIPLGMTNDDVIAVRDVDSGGMACPYEETAGAQAAVEIEVAKNGAARYIFQVGQTHSIE